jgi:hypothetical protein
VRVARGWDAGSDVEELPDARVHDQVTDRPPEKRPVRPCAEGHVRPDLERCVHGGPVRRVIVLAAEYVVVHPGLVRHGDVEGQRPSLFAA